MTRYLLDVIVLIALIRALCITILHMTGSPSLVGLLLRPVQLLKMACCASLARRAMLTLPARPLRWRRFWRLC